MINFSIEIKNKSDILAAYDDTKVTIRCGLKSIVCKAPKERHLIDFLIKNVESNDYFLLEYEELLNLITVINSYQCTDEDFLKSIKKAFNYSLFRKKHGVKIVQNFPCKTCYYCNGQLIGMNIKHNSLILQFDHFFPQDLYPYLAISYYNLIPSCASCNQRKSDYDPVNPKERIYLKSPYDNNCNCIDDALCFKFDDVTLINRYIGKEVDVKFAYNINVTWIPEEEINAYFEKFKINDLYNFHAANLNDLADVFIKYIYTNKPNKQLFINQYEIIRFWVGVDIQDRNILHKPMGKITKELVEKLYYDFHRLKII
jgi:hypothetical protein